ncbi:MAG: ACP S-malonyltransferase [Pseudomonadota bacterium]
MNFAFTFPGQGSQAVAMGRPLYERYPAARAVFEEVDDALGEPLSKTIFEGPEEALRLTRNAQPALMAVSLAAVRAAEAEGIRVSDAAMVAGHSLGEYSALASAGALELGDAARLLRLRGDAMQAAVAEGEGAMAALLGLDLEAAEAVAEDARKEGVCDVANDNAPGQVVISGARAAVEAGVAAAKEKGAKRAVLLPVSAPFHCGLMAPAGEAMANALKIAEVRAPCVPLMANISAKLLTAPDAIRTSLVAQVTGRVRWRESVAAMAASGVTTLVEIGAGKVLTGLAKRIDKSLEAFAVNNPEDLAALVEKRAA